MKLRYIFSTLFIFGLLLGHISAQQEAELKADGIVFPILSAYPAGATLGQVIYYTPTAKLEYFNGTIWQAVDAGGGISGTDKIEDSSDGDTYVRAVEAGSADYVQIKLEGTAGQIQFRPCPNGDVRMETISTGYNCLVGNNAGDALLADGINNSCFGSWSGSGITTGDANTMLGYYAGYTNTTGSSNTYLGRSAGYSNNGTENTILGYRAAAFGTSNFNTIMGSRAMENMDNFSTENVVIGREAGQNADLTSYSVLIGYQAGENLETGYNVMIGYQAGQNQNNINQTMRDNVCIGFKAGQENDGNRNVYLGNQAGTNNQGDGNVFIGNSAGSLPTAVDNQLRIMNQSSGEPLIFGDFANKRIGINTDASSAVAILVDAEPGDDLIRLRAGTSTQFMVHDNGRVSIGTATTPSYRFQLPNNAIVGEGHARATGWATYSDERIKSNIKTLTSGLDVVRQLNPVSYRQHASIFEENGIEIDQTNYTNSVGFLAQELEKVMPEVVHRPENESTDLWSVTYEKLIPVLTKAIQEQQTMIDQLQSRIDQLENSNK